MLPAQDSAPDFIATTATTITTTDTTISSTSINQECLVTSMEGGDMSASEEPNVLAQRSPGIVNPPGFPLPPTGPPSDHPCMRVFRCVPPLYEAWTPLRHLPTHLAQQMATYSLVSAPFVLDPQHLKQYPL